MKDFIQNNILHLIPILGCGVLGLTIILERLWALYFKYPMDSKNFFGLLRALILENKLNEGLALCQQHRKKPLAGIVREGLLRANQPQEIIENGLLVSVGEHVDLVKARTGYLSMIANVSTLLGLIGTILGLIQAFEAVGGASAQMRSALLAQGISTAMNHTLFGLSVAVPCMVFYSFLMNKTNRLKAELERGAVKLMDLFQQRDIIAIEQEYSKRSRDGYRRA